jgi:hypothetical protein
MTSSESTPSPSAFLFGSRVPLALVALALLTATTGCNRGPARPVVQRVEGVVTLDGQPVEAATVGFAPAGAGTGAFGRTRSDGGFTLTSSQGGTPGAGAVAGDYTVTIQKVEGDVAAEADAAPPAESTPEDYEKWRRESMNNAAKPAQVKYLIPKAYGDPQTSGLKATVKKGLNNGPDFRFELKGDFNGAGM